MDPETKAALTYWKNHRYQYHHLPFGEAVRSLATKNPLVEIRAASRPNEWVVCHAGTTTPAVMTYAGIFSEAEPYETGNLVWGNNDAPSNLEESRITHFAGYKASYSFALETYHDREIWELQRDIEEHVVSVAGFNVDRVPRLEWQNGHVAMMRFFIRVPMFFPHQTRGPQPRAPDGLHPWVRAAHAKTRSHRANPRAPKVRAIENGVLRPISECAQKELEYGDVIGLVFTLSFVVNPTNWSPVYMLTDVIRVKTANRDTFPVPGAADLDDSPSYDDNFSITDTPNHPALMASPPSPAVTSPPMDAPTSPMLSDGAAQVVDAQVHRDEAPSPPPAYDHISSDGQVRMVNGDGPLGSAPGPFVSQRDADDEDGTSSTTETSRRSSGSSPPHELESSTSNVGRGRPSGLLHSSEGAPGDRPEVDMVASRTGPKGRKPPTSSKPRRG